MFSRRGFIAFIIGAVFLIINSSHGSEIIDGKEVKPQHSLPFMALLWSKEWVCGGTLIDQQWVLTAAHCEAITTVLLGVHSIKDKTEQAYRQVRKVKRRVPHPCFDKTEKVHDLMLLKLDKPVKQTKWVKSLKLKNVVKQPAAGSLCLVAGWGATSTNSTEMSDVLMSANVTVIDRMKCNSPKHYNHDPYITKDMICAGPNGENNADTCQGDSGGPLLCNGVLVGVTSFGGNCGSAVKPGVYAFLSENHLNWIKKTMKTSETE